MTDPVDALAQVLAERAYAHGVPYGSHFPRDLAQAALASGVVVAADKVRAGNPLEVRAVEDPDFVLPWNEEPATDAAPCPTCSTGPVRETVGMVCQTCGTDYAATDTAPTGEAQTSDRLGVTGAEVAENWRRNTQALRENAARTAQDATKPPHPYPSDPPTGTTRQEDA